MIFDGNYAMFINRGARSVMVTRVQIQDEAVCISNSANIFGKGINSIIFPLTMGK